MGAALTYAPPPNLASEASAILWDPLLAELDKLGLKGDLDAWTLQAWPRAITLTPADGDKVRVAFRARLDRLQTIPDEDLSPAEVADAVVCEPAPCLFP